MAKKSKYEVFLPPIELEEINFKTLNSEVLDYWHGLVKTQDAFKETKGEGVVVFVLDTTYKTTHPDLVDNILPDFAKSFIDGPGDEDTNGHGIHCMGLVAGVDNEIGVVGAAPKAKLIPVRVLNNSGQGTWTSVANGIRYAADVDLGKYNNYKRVISLSLGSSKGDRQLKSAMKHAVEKGCYPVVAAGNSGYDGKDTVGFPGAYDPYAITISSVSKGWRPSYFSSGGKSVDVASFGESIYSTYKNGTYARLSGTSMATPIAAGLIALILSKYKDYKPSLTQLEAYVKMYARDLLTEGEDDQTGAGAIVIDNYFKNPPSDEPPADDPDEPDDPTEEPDEPQEPVMPERVLPLVFREDFKMVWGYTMASDASFEAIPISKIQTLENKKILTIKELRIDVKTTRPFDALYDDYLKFFADFFTNRGIVVPRGSDFKDATKWTIHFTSMFLDKRGLTKKIKSAETWDEAGRILDWPDEYVWR